MSVTVRIPQTLTAFACAVDPAGRILLILHERLGVRRWELPGGHVEVGESVFRAAARETAEESGVSVRCGNLVAEGLHRWRGRTVAMVFLQAAPIIDGCAASGPCGVAPQTEPAIRDVGWFDLAGIDLKTVSPMAAPVLDHLRRWERFTTLRFEATHHETEAGREPVLTRSWRSAVCKS